TFDLYQRAMASTTRILDLLDTPLGIENGEVVLDEVRGKVRFEGVRFAYDNGTEVLHDLSLDAPAGDTVAMVGASGTRKSTIVKLLLGFYDPIGGTIRLDGRDLRELDRASLRRAIGLVSQDVFLFHGSVRDNIAYGRPHASLDEIIAAARAAEAHEFIERL